MSEEHIPQDSEYIRVTDSLQDEYPELAYVLMTIRGTMTDTIRVCPQVSVVMDVLEEVRDELTGLIRNGHLNGYKALSSSFAIDTDENQVETSTVEVNTTLVLTDGKEVPVTFVGTLPNPPPESDVIVSVTPV